MLPTTIVLFLMPLIYAKIPNNIPRSFWAKMPSTVQTCNKNEYCSFSCEFVLNHFVLKYINYDYQNDNIAFFNDNHSEDDEFFFIYSFDNRNSFTIYPREDDSYFPFFLRSSINDNKTEISFLFNGTISGYYLYFCWAHYIIPKTPGNFLDPSYTVLKFITIYIKESNITNSIIMQTDSMQTAAIIQNDCKFNDFNNFIYYQIPILILICISLFIIACTLILLIYIIIKKCFTKIEIKPPESIALKSIHHRHTSIEDDPNADCS